MNQTLISIIVPTCNRPGDLRKCLSLLLAQIKGQNDVELLVCDDSQSSSTRLVVTSEFPDVVWLQGPQRGPASNRNVGARTAKGDWLIFIDDDCLPQSSLLPAYRETMNSLRNDARVALEGPTFRIGEPDSLLWEAPHSPEGGSLISCNFAIPRELFWKAGGFDERFPMAFFEDTEFAARLDRQDVKIHFVKEAAVDHPLRPLPKARKLAFRWQSRVISSYDFGAKRWQVLWYLPRHVLLVILSRFRNQKLSLANLKAATIFATEYLIFLQRLPGWCRRFENTRSRFWGDPAQASALPKRFGL